MVTNIAAMNALSALRSLNADMTEASNRIATGQRINTAADAPAFWGAIAETKADVGVLRQMDSTLKFGSGLMATTSAGLNTVREALLDMRDIFVSATPAGADRTALQQGIAAAQDSINSALSASSFNGVNLLTEADATGTFSVVTGWSGTAVTTIDLDVTRVNLGAAGGDGVLTTDFTFAGGNAQALTIDISAVADADAATNMAEAIAGIDSALDALEIAEVTVGTAENAINSQINFNAAMINAKESALNSLVEADVEAEAAKLTSIQTRQQLALEALSISNSSVSAVLALFR